tara:strand:- start:297 stop:1043 length:747 start_codon:yes stop_codon:yes gene_type:complete
MCYVSDSLALNTKKKYLCSTSRSVLDNNQSRYCIGNIFYASHTSIRKYYIDENGNTATLSCSATCVGSTFNEALCKATKSAEGLSNIEVNRLRYKGDFNCGYNESVTELCRWDSIKYGFTITVQTSASANGSTRDIALKNARCLAKRLGNLQAEKDGRERERFYDEESTRRKFIYECETTDEVCCNAEETTHCHYTNLHPPRVTCHQQYISQPRSPFPLYQAYQHNVHHHIRPNNELRIVTNCRTGCC